MLQAAVFDSASFGPLSLRQDDPVASNIDAGGSKVIQVFVVAPVIVILDDGLDVGFEHTRQSVVFQPGPILQGLMPALDLAPGLGVERGHRTSQPKFCAIGSEREQCAKNT